MYELNTPLVPIVVPTHNLFPHIIKGPLLPMPLP